MPLGANKAAIMGVAGVSTGDVVLLSSQTASSDSTIEFTSGITSTYGEYIFKFYNINPATDNVNFTVTFSTDGGSSYGITTTSTWVGPFHNEADDNAYLNYQEGLDITQSTSAVPLAGNVGNGSDESAAGEFHLFNPSSTTYVKHFHSTINFHHHSSASYLGFIGGYVNSTGDVDAVQFACASGNFDGTIKMWGVK